MLIHDAHVGSNLSSMTPACREQLSPLTQALRSSRTPDCHVYTQAISRCRASEWQHAIHIFQSMLTVLVRADTCSVNAVLSAAARAGQWLLALAAGVSADVFTLGARLMAYKVTHHWVRALRASTLAGGNLITISNAISACNKEWRHALLLLRTTSMDTIACSATVSACEKAGEWESALRLFQALCRTVCADVVAFNAAISSCEKGGQWLRAVVFLHMLERHLRPSRISFNASISAFALAGCWSTALSLLCTMKCLATGVDVLSCSSAMSACGTAQRWMWSGELLRHMMQTRLQPNLVTFNAALGEWCHAFWQLDLQAARQVPPDAFSHATTMSSCEPMGLWQAALQLLNPTSTVGFNTLIGACARAEGLQPQSC